MKTALFRTFNAKPCNSLRTFSKVRNAEQDGINKNMTIPNSKKDDPSKVKPSTGTGPAGAGAPPKPGEDYKEKFSQSTAENQRLMTQVIPEKDKAISEKDAKIAELEAQVLSEEELINEFPDFEEMSPEEQKGARTQLVSKKRLRSLEAKQKMREDYEALPQDIRKKIEKKGGYNAFRDFACSPDNAGQKNLLNLAKSFVFEEGGEEPPATIEEPRPGLEEAPGGGPKVEIPPEGTMTAAEAAELRRSNPEKHADLIRQHKLIIKD